MENKLKILLIALGIGFVALVVWVVRTTPDAPPPVEKLNHLKPLNMREIPSAKKKMELRFGN